jgi:ATP-dependent DNA helicase RecG
MLNFSTPISKFALISPTFQKHLENLGITTVGDLLYHFPFRFDDFSIHKKIESLAVGEIVTVIGQIEKIKTIRTWKRKMTITEGWIKDDSGMIKSVWFNLPLPIKFLSKGKTVQISGKVALGKNNEFYFQHPNIELESGALKGNSLSTNTGGLAPVYPETKGLTSYWLRRTIKKILVLVEPEEIIPNDILKSQDLLSLEKALWQIHFPKNQKQAAAAKKRFAFEKMFLVQLKALQVKKAWQENQATKIPFNEAFIKSFVDKLPFKLTDAQKKSAWQIIKDLEKPQPMNRLLEGDVGSGKTVVAALAAVSAMNQGYQVAILAPTEVLAIQHFEGLKKLFKSFKFRVILLTGSKTVSNQAKRVARKNILEEISSGKISLAIGTHALLQKKVRFKNLALIVIDEQHRFGVQQRAFLQQETLNLDDGMQSASRRKIPHLLTMTATPIPRTLSLAIFGNLELSIIDEMPKGRKPIITKVILTKGREQIYQFIKKQVSEGRQVFIIYPLVEETSKMSEVKAATEEQQRLQEKIFPELKIGLLHGRLKSKEKEAIMRDFKDKKYDILVSTSVVEVGVDVPNATIMMIEGAERFGLSQLHQFRGRVGRADHQSYCFLFTSDNAPNTTNRLRAMEQTNDGFKIAEYDLKLRGPGQFLGTMQSGAPDIAMESLTDVKTIQAARTEAARIIAFDPELKKFPLLREQVDHLQSMVHWE